jgi:hypothetical protein
LLSYFECVELIVGRCSFYPGIKGQCEGKLYGDNKNNFAVEPEEERRDLSPYALPDLMKKWALGLGVLQLPVQEQWKRHNCEVAVVSVPFETMPKALTELRATDIHRRNKSFESIGLGQVSVSLYC